MLPRSKRDCRVRCHDQPALCRPRTSSASSHMYMYIQTSPPSRTPFPWQHVPLCPMPMRPFPTWIVFDQVLHLLVPQRLAGEDEGDHRAAPHAGEELIHRVAPDGERPRGCATRRGRASAMIRTLFLAACIRRRHFCMPATSSTHAP